MIGVQKYKLLVDKSNGECYYCEIPFDLIPGNHITVDHLKPKKKGGTDSIENLALCCRTCNSQKGKKTEEQYRKYIEIKQSKEYHEYLCLSQYYKNLFNSLNT